LLNVVLFGFLNIKSVKIYAIPYIFSTTLLLYKLDTLLLKEKNLPVLDITGFFVRICTQVTALVLRISAFTWVIMLKKKPVISNTGRFFCFNRIEYVYLSIKDAHDRQYNYMKITIFTLIGMIRLIDLTYKTYKYM
jgi:hypothetical protein